VGPVKSMVLTIYKNQCCGSETFILGPVSDPDPAFSEFRILIQIQILDTNPYPDPGFESDRNRPKLLFLTEEVGTAFLKK
jgi:hypothetical protein